MRTYTMKKRIVIFIFFLWFSSPTATATIFTHTGDTLQIINITDSSKSVTPPDYVEISNLAFGDRVSGYYRVNISLWSSSGTKQVAAVLRDWQNVYETASCSTTSTTAITCTYDTASTVLKSTTGVRVLVTGDFGATAYVDNVSVYYVPNTPAPANIASTYGGSYWVNTTWSNGTNGNAVTDAYNVSVNGSWYNTTDNFFNSTTSHWSNVTVYSFNKTEGMNATSVTKNTNVPDNVPTTPQITNIANNSRTWNNTENITFGASTDADGDIITYHWQMSNLNDFSGNLVEGNTSNNFSGSVATKDGMTNYTRVRAYDTYNYSGWSSIINFTENTAPTSSNASLTPATAGVTNNLSITISTFDAEGDSLTNHYLWYKNSVLNTSWNDSAYINYTGNNFTTGDIIYVVGYASDGYENGNTAQSNTVNIGSGNSAPTLSGIALNPSNQKYNKSIWVNSSTAIADAESSTIIFRTYYKNASGNVYLGNSSWITPGSPVNVSITIPWRDGVIHTIFASAEDSGNATGYNNLTSSEVSATFTSNITPPTVTASSVDVSEIKTGEQAIISATFQGAGVNVSSAIVRVLRPDATEANWTMTCGTAAENVTCIKIYTATADVGMYYVTYFYPLDESGDEGAVSSDLEFRVITTQGGSTGGGGGGGGGGGSTSPTPTPTSTESKIQQLISQNITTGATEPEAIEIADCLTQSLTMNNKCSRLNYGVVIEPFNWWVAIGTFVGTATVLFSKSLWDDDKRRDFFTDMVIFGTVTTIIVAALVGVGFNVFFINYLFNSPLYAWTFTSFIAWGMLGGAIGDVLMERKQFKHYLEGVKIQ